MSNIVLPGTAGVLRAMVRGFQAVRWPLAALALILLFNAFQTPGFFNIEWRSGRLYGVPVDVMNHGARIAIVALGMCLVIATSGIDLSVGAIAAISGAVAGAMLANSQPWTLASGAGIAAAAACGVWNAMLVNRAGLQPIVATLILMVAGRGVAQLITRGYVVTFDNSHFAWLGNGSLFGLPGAIWLLLIIASAMGALCLLTNFRLFVEAAGDNPTAARFVGLPISHIRMAAYVACAVAAGLSGLIETAYIRAADVNNIGQALELDAIIAVVIGGTSLSGGRFNLTGAVLGALVMQALTKTMYMHDVSADIAPAPKAAVILAFCLLQSPRVRAAIARARARSGAPRAGSAS